MIYNTLKIPAPPLQTPPQQGSKSFFPSVSALLLEAGWPGFSRQATPPSAPRPPPPSGSTGWPAGPSWLPSLPRLPACTSRLKSKVGHKEVNRLLFPPVSPPSPRPRPLPGNCHPQLPLIPLQLTEPAWARDSSLANQSTLPIPTRPYGLLHSQSGIQT